MSFDRSYLLGRLDELETEAESPRRLIVAFSGGLDSSVLLHALARSRDDHGCPLIAVHVDHGLHDESGAWCRHCESFAKSLGVEFMSLAVQVDPASGQGPEAAAREARYGALRRLVKSGDWLLSAHHQDDQAETLLLHLMRSSGPSGLAGIRAIRRFVSGWLARPLLDVPRNDLEAYAAEHDIGYVDDPGNVDTEYDRNFLRHEVIPLLESRWQGAAARIRRSADLQREAGELLAALAELDGQAVSGDANRMHIPDVAALPEERQRNLLRHQLASLGLPLPGAAQLEQIVREVLPAREDAQPAVAWPGGQARRYRDKLYLMSAKVEDAPPAEPQAVDGGRAVLAPGLGKILLRPGQDVGLSEAVISAGLEIRYRAGGEEIKPLFQQHTKKLKKLLQEEGVVPWMRDRVPLLYSGGTLVAVADLWIADDASSEPGTGIEWCDRPALY